MRRIGESLVLLIIYAVAIRRLMRGQCNGHLRRTGQAG